MKDGKKVILCIDDDPDMLAALRVILEHNQYVMVAAESAEAGLKAYKAHKPDFVICDLMMEEVDSGRNFARELKLLGNAAPVYLLSAAGDSLVSTIDFAELGLNGVFQKPIDAGTLLATLKARIG